MYPAVSCLRRECRTNTGAAAEVCLLYRNVSGPAIRSTVGPPARRDSDRRRSAVFETSMARPVCFIMHALRQCWSVSRLAATLNLAAITHADGPASAGSGGTGPRTARMSRRWARWWHGSVASPARHRTSSHAVRRLTGDNRSAKQHAVFLLRHHDTATGGIGVEFAPAAGWRHGRRSNATCRCRNLGD